MIKAGVVVLRCAYPLCENEPRPGAAERGDFGLPDPATGESCLALTEAGWR